MDGMMLASGAVSPMLLGRELGAVIRARTAMERAVSAQAKAGSLAKRAKAESALAACDRRREAIEDLLSVTPPATPEDTLPLLLRALALVNEIADSSDEFANSADRASDILTACMVTLAAAHHVNLKALGAGFYSHPLSVLFGRD